MPENEVNEDVRSAEKWYFDLLRAELAARDKSDAAPAIEHLLKLVPAGGTDHSSPAQFSLLQRISECEVRLNGNTGEQISWFLDFVSTGGNQSMTPAAALQFAVQIATPPSDAELEMAEYETMDDRTFFRVRWIHRYQSLEVEGDYIEVLINAAVGKAFSFSRVWRQPNLTTTAMVR
jgi:hypothetical protein